MTCDGVSPTEQPRALTGTLYVSELAAAGIMLLALDDGRMMVVVAHVLPAHTAVGLGKSMMVMGRQGPARMEDEFLRREKEALTREGRQ